MPLRRRARAEASGSLPKNGDEPAIAEYKIADPTNVGEQFLWTHHEALSNSVSIWHGVSSVFEPFANGEVQANLLAFYEQRVQKRDIPEHRRGALLNQINAKMSKLPGDLATYLFVFSSWRSNAQTYPTTAKGLIRETKTNNPKIDDGLEHLFEQEAYSSGFLKLPGMMSEARGIRKHVINDLVLVARENPDVFKQLAEVPASDPDYGKYLAELRRLCAVDWHATDPDLSMLRQHVYGLGFDNDVFLDAFVQRVSRAEQQTNGNKDRLLAIRRMAQFALAAQGLDPSSRPEIERILMATRERWQAFAELDQAYTDFRKQMVAQLHAEIERFVGTAHSAKTDIRAPRSDEDFSLAKETFGWYFETTGATKKEREARARLLSQAAFPDAARLVAEREAAVEKIYQVGSLKLVPGDGYVIDVTEDVFEAHLKKYDNDPRLKEELRRMIQAVIDNPFSRGTETLKSQKNAITLNKRRLPLRRFSPISEPGFVTNSSTARGMRVIYCVDRETDTVGISRVCRRDEEGKLYGH